MRTINLVSIIILLLSLSFLFAEEGKVNFSGEWNLNQDKSEIGGGGRGRGGGSSKLVVKQEDNKLTIDRTSRNRDGEEFIRTTELTLDGKETKTEGFRGSEQTTTANWTDNGNTLTISSVAIYERDGQEFEMNSTEVWHLQENGKVLSIESTRTTPRGERTSKLVYDKAV
jgi:hypothetical protein